MSEEKFSKCEEGGKEKKCKCRISGVRKKMEIERKVPEKMIKILLSSCSLVGRKGFRCSEGNVWQITKKSFGCGLPR